MTSNRLRALGRCVSFTWSSGRLQKAEIAGLPDDRKNSWKLFTENNGPCVFPERKFSVKLCRKNINKLEPGLSLIRGRQLDREIDRWDWSKPGAGSWNHYNLQASKLLTSVVCWIGLTLSNWKVESLGIPVVVNNLVPYDKILLFFFLSCCPMKETRLKT